MVKRYKEEIELYNLDIDKGEELNVASNYPKILKKMIKILKTARTENPDFPLIKLR